MWRSQGLVDTLAPNVVSRFELFGTDTAEVTLSADVIVEASDVVGHRIHRDLAVLVDLLL